MANSVGQGQNVQVPNYSGVNIQIFNPAVVTPGITNPVSNVNMPTYTNNTSYPANYYTQNLSQPVPSASPVKPAQPQAEEETKKTEKREIVQLTDDYIRNLEMYLSDTENKDVRLMGAKEVLARLQEDPIRKDDEALNALVNKMLKDPYEPVKFIAMAALESRAATGNQETVEILEGIQQPKSDAPMANEDALKASNILLKMSGTTVEKEFEVKDKPEKEKES